MGKERVMPRGVFLTLAPLAALLLLGCGNAAQDSGSSQAASAVQASSTKTGAQLWAENCNRCHNYRPPTSFSDTQWEAVVMHMRLRADLTGEERRKITEFMKLSH